LACSLVIFSLAELVEGEVVKAGSLAKLIKAVPLVMKARLCYFFL
jgi:hypothetical protein